MAEKLKRGDAVKVQLSSKHTLDGEMVEHAANFVRYHPDGEWADVELERHHSTDSDGRKIHRLSVPIAQLVAAVLLFFLFVIPASAQDLGNVALRTVSANLATALNCTGVAQTFVTGTTPNFNNLGQTGHTVTIAPQNMTSMHAEIDGVDNQGNVFRISDQMEFAGVTAVRQGSMRATGYYARIQVMITCSPNTATFTATYSGDFGNSPSLPGSYLSSQIDHVNFSAANGTVSQQDNFQTPFGSSAGTLYVQTGSSAPAGNSIAITCNGVGLGAAIGLPFSGTLAPTTGVQAFPIPASACPLMQVGFGPSGGGVTTITAEMVFSVPGLATNNPANQPATGVDPCQSPSTLKQSQPINVVAAATTQLVPAATIQGIYVCGGFLTVGSSGTTPATALFEYGTGASCGTGTTVLTGAMGTGTATATNDGEPVTIPGGVTNFRAPTGNALCIVTAGTTVNVQGYISYVQQ